MIRAIVTEAIVEFDRAVIVIVQLQVISMQISFQFPLNRKSKSSFKCFAHIYVAPQSRSFHIHPIISCQLNLNLALITSRQRELASDIMVSKKEFQAK